ncbi:MAG: response regulator [Planctomycetota bacterium]
MNEASKQYSNGTHGPSDGGAGGGAGGGSGGESETPDWSGKKIFTTGEAAQVCKVSQQTIIRCFDSGRLSGFRVPGSRFRRIPRDELIRFMKTNGIPLDAIEGGGPKRVLVVDDDPQIAELFSDMLGADGRFEVKTAGTGYDAGLLTESFRPHVIVLDYMLPDINGNIVCERIRANDELSDAKIIFVSGVVNRQEIEQLLSAGADDFVKKPFDVNEFMGKLEKLLELEPAETNNG